VVGSFRGNESGGVMIQINQKGGGSRPLAL